MLPLEGSISFKWLFHGTEVKLDEEGKENA